MYQSIVEKLVCPICRQALEITNITQKESEEIIEGNLACQDGHSWIIRDGVLNLGSEEQEIGNNWSEYYKNTDYNTLDRKIAAATPEDHKNGYDVAKKCVMNHIKQAKNIIDIATGRGMLLTYIAKYLERDVNLVCVDLSHEVLKYDRIKVKEVSPHLKVNYIACDATNLPFRDDTFDISISFFGIMNMGPVIEQGIHDAVRVSRNGLINVGIIIRDDNPKLEKVYNFLSDNNVSMDFDFCKETNSLKLHDAQGAYQVSEEKVYESVGQPNKLDLIPIEGEWFGISLYHTKRR